MKPPVVVAHNVSIEIFGKEILSGTMSEIGWNKVQDAVESARKVGFALLLLLVCVASAYCGWWCGRDAPVLFCMILFWCSVIVAALFLVLLATEFDDFPGVLMVVAGLSCIFALSDILAWAFYERGNLFEFLLGFKF